MLSASITKEKMIDALKLAIQYVENNEAQVRISMESEPMFIEATTIDTPIEPTLHKVRLVIETERYM